MINGDIGIFNLLPMFPWDVGRILWEVLILLGGSPTVLDRLSWACTRWCAAVVLVYGIICRDLFLADLVVLLWLLARWLLSENLTKVQP